MAGEDRHELVEAARVRAELTVSELWLRYVALGGNGDLFDVDGYLAGLLPPSALEENVLAVAVNERLDELYRAARVPLSTGTSGPLPRAGLDDVVAALLDPGPPVRPAPGDAPQPGDPPPAAPGRPGNAS